MNLSSNLLAQGLARDALRRKEAELQQKIDEEGCGAVFCALLASTGRL